MTGASEGYPLLEELAWTPVEEGLARRLFARAAGVDEDRIDELASLGVAAATAPLPCYPRTRLLRIESEAAGQGRQLPTVFALWDPEGAFIVLDGSSDPVHAVNVRDDLEITADCAPDYLRFFCFAVRGSEGPFMLLERLPPGANDAPEALTALVRQLAPRGRDEAGRLLYEASLAYDGDVFRAVFAISSGGDVEMIEDEPLLAEVDEDALPNMPHLGSLTPAEVYFASREGTTPPDLGAIIEGVNSLTASAPPPAPAREPALRVLVELMLVRALRERSRHRLIENFNATQAAQGELDQFAALMVGAFPVVVVESAMPFVEETIAEIVLERSPSASLTVVRATTGMDDGQVAVSVPSTQPSLVLLPLQVYRRVADLDRLAYDLAVRNAAAIIACDRFQQLPESLRSLTDVTLSLPPVDGALFEELFERVIGAPLPSDWAADGDQWVKYVLHTDFEQPRRLGLLPTEAFAYVRSSVLERLGTVETEDALGLDELHGLGEARRFAEDLIADIHAAIRGEIEWSQVDRGALLVGPPGTGKTTLARAIAKDCGVRFIDASATGWQATGEHLGHHISAIRKTFAEARMYAPSILFIDEIDSLGSRERLVGSGAQYQIEVVNAVLEQVQELDPEAPVFVIGATNHEDRVDSALRRSGRLDRVISIPRPNSEVLGHIYDHYLRKIGHLQPLGEDLDVAELGGLSLGLTGADVERIVRGAARRARRERQPLGQLHVFAEITNKPRDPSESHRLTPEEIERVAVHEAGHALAMALSASRGRDIGFVTVVPRADGSLGFVARLPDERMSLTRGDYDELLEVSLAGRAAEEVRYGDAGVSGGATDDLRVATGIATRLITKLGLGGPRKLVWSETLAERDVLLLEKIVSDAYESALGKLSQHRDRLTALADALVARQELTGDEVRAILSV